MQDLQDLVQDLASLARKILARLGYFLQDRFYWVIALVLYKHVIRRLTNGITVMYITHGFMDSFGNNDFTNPITSFCLELIVHTIHFPLDLCFLLQFIIAMFTGLMACLIYCPFTTWRPCMCVKQLAFIRI